MTYHIEEIAQVLGAHRVGTSEAKINWLLIDSRSLCFPEETLFFALKTSKNDGHRYIGGLYRRGVRNFVVSLQFLDDNAEVERMADANFLAVESPLKALQTLAAHHRNSLNIPIIGIIFALLGSLIELYSLVGIILCVLNFLGILK